MSNDPVPPRKILSIDEIRAQARQRELPFEGDASDDAPFPGGEPGHEPPPPLEFEPEAPPPGLWERVGDVHPGFTYAIVLLLLVGFAIELVTATASVGDILAGGSLRGPVIAWGATSRAPLFGGEWWRALSSIFLHANLAHVGANAAALALAGGVAERVFGHARFLVLFTVAALGGTIGTLAHQGALGGAALGSIGASGAVYGVWAAVVIAIFRMRGLLPPWRVRALLGVTLPLLAVSLVGGLARPGTDNAAHLGGALAGIALGLVLPFSPALPGRPEGPASRLGWALLGLVGFGLLIASGVVAFGRGLAPGA